MVLANECTHREYYAQFVTPANKADVVRMFGMKALLDSTDKHLNDLPLRKWDTLSTYNVAAKMKEAGDYLTLSSVVCINKEAARQVIEEHKHEMRQAAKTIQLQGDIDDFGWCNELFESYIAQRR